MAESQAPMPSTASQMTPVERKRLADEARLKDKDRQIAELELQLREVRRRAGQDHVEPRKDEDGWVRPMVHLGDLTGQAGNAFAIMGAMRQNLKQQEDAGQKFNPKATDVLDSFTSRRYDENLALIETYWDDIDDSIPALRAHRRDLS